MILTIFRADIAEKYGAPVYSRHPPITAIFPAQLLTRGESEKEGIGRSLELVPSVQTR